MPTLFQPRDESQVPLYKDGLPVTDEYEFEPGVCVLPIAEDPPSTDEELKNWSPVVVLRLHAPYRIRRSLASTNKQVNPPVMPSPTDSGKFVFIGGGIHFEKSLNSGLATYDWFVQSEYIYVENCPSRTKDGFVLTSPPWTTQIADDNAAIGVPGVSQIGAISDAGTDAKIGYDFGQQIVDANGNLKFSWAYNTAAFYPGVLLSSDMVNGGPTVFVAPQLPF